ncbi:Uncharacterised protein [BD1-7 clade bacterium]|uniref:Uncharacterized protein n=1 Tax=BD1-7 clade bacterium TaxID=2029982 RepID=A0A5S9N641_9GAMM|nr:Uncharacterised protein [BD1-7 clade bacterium]
MKEIALITLHGMGENPKNYAQPLAKNLQQTMGDAWRKVSFQQVQYADLLQKPQNKLWQDMISAPGNNMDFQKLRRFFLHSFGDAGSLEYSARHNQDKYLATQQTIQTALLNALNDLGNDPSKPVVIIAHSLGCQVICNYLWDAQHNRHIFDAAPSRSAQQNQFLRLHSLAGLITIGCNIPLFVSGIDQRQCFAAPNDQFRWDNYYDPDDVLGWPLKQMGDSFSIVNDQPLDVGSALTGWTPLSHTQYWTDEGVSERVARRLLTAINQPVAAMEYNS